MHAREQIVKGVFKLRYIRNWFFNGVNLHGLVYVQLDSGLYKGQLIRTSKVTEVKGSKIKTSSGSSYTLGTPTVAYIQEVESAATKFDSSNPIPKELCDSENVTWDKA